LLQDDTTVFFFPFPSIFQEFITADGCFLNAFFFQHSNDFRLSSNGCMVRSRNPTCIFALHTCTTDQHILNGVVQHMAHVKDPSDVWRWHDNGVWLTLIWYRTEKSI